MVQLDDENWYHVDVGSDITYGNFENFNMNDDVASYKHTWDTAFFPAATGTKYCYALMKAGEVKDLSAAQWMRAREGRRIICAKRQHTG